MNRVSEWIGSAVSGFKVEMPVGRRLAKRRVEVLAWSIGIGYVAMSIWCYFRASVLGDRYPFNSFLYNPLDRFMDFMNTVAMSKSLDPYWTGSRSAYPPLANLLFFFFSLPPLGIALAVFIGIPMAIVLNWGFRVLKPLGLRYQLIGSLLLFGFNYGLIFGIDRGNLDLYVLAALIPWWDFYGRQGAVAEWARILLLAFAISLKLYPALLCLVLVKDFRWKELFLVAGMGVFLTVGSGAALNGGPINALLDWRDVLHLLGQQVASDISYTYFSCSLAGGIRLFTYLVFGFDPVRTVNLFYGPLVVGCLVVATVWMLQRAFHRWQVMAVCVIGMILLPSVSYDYKLALVILVVPSVVWASSTGVGIRHVLIGGSVVLLSIPKHYFAVYNGGTSSPLSIASLIDPAVLLLLLGCVLMPDSKNEPDSSTSLMTRGPSI